MDNQYSSALDLEPHHQIQLVSCIEHAENHLMEIIFDVEITLNHQTLHFNDGQQEGDYLSKISFEEFHTL